MKESRNSEIRLSLQIPQGVTVMMRGVFALVVAWMPMVQVQAVSSNADFYVAPEGDDSFPGTKQKPFASLGRARDAVRELKASDGSRDIIVLLRGGEYRLAETVVFSLEDSAQEGHTISYAAYPGELPVFVSGLPIEGWQKAVPDPEGLPSSARGKIWKARCPEGVAKFFTLYHQNERLPRSRTEGFLPPNKAEAYKVEDQNELIFPKGAVRVGPNIDDWELVAITAAPWSMNILPVESVDQKAGILRTAVRGSYALSRPLFGEFTKSAWIENSFSGLNQPGEWVFDSEKRTIYIWPKDGHRGTDVIVPNLTELLRVEGVVDYEGPNDQPVRGLVFRGLTFSRADRFSWDQSGQGYGLQHDWEVFDAPTAMVRFRGAENCVIDQCKFKNSGASAIRLDLHCQDNRVTDNEIAHVGGAGIVLAGYGPGTKDVNRRNRITGNHIHHVGELYWHSPGIMIWQSGENLVANNLIHDTPYTGIVVSGRIVWNRKGSGDCVRTIRWNEVDSVLGADFRGKPDWKIREPFLHARNNRVERNEIHHVMKVLSDGNGIYISGAGGGNAIKENFVHDCPSNLFLQGIRCDDDQHETVIDRNVIWRIGGWAEFVLIKGRNDVTGNIFAVPLTPPKRGMLVLNPTEPDGTDGSIVQRNIFYTVRKDDKVVGEKFENSGKRGRGRLHRCIADNNLYYNSAEPNWGRRHIKSERNFDSESNSISANPRFRDLSKGNFALRSSSPALELGFEPIDLRQVGLKAAADKSP